ncbi:hypothetical protein PSTT_05236 [Puccinia striiformis]|uniref:HAT C-terminal dimerisation domain-containing protein n=1 Tax=Puccinia striiformis TaxID=27350 RepID=A0A2S4VPK5_9BASI|nr:hypothetical protein PSTT_05236 [Puccinia striiformis]
MPTSRKCKKNNHTSLESSAISSPTNRDDTNEADGDVNSHGEPSLLAALRPRKRLMKKSYVKRARLTYTNGISDSYQYYLTPELSNQLDKHKRRMIAYPCRFNLNKHVAGCLRKQNNSKKTHTLASLGIKGTGEINPKEVPQLCAVWCAEAARPFSALVDESHQAILHPTIVKHLPTRKAVSKDIHMLYSAIQESYKAILNAHKGVDAWQSPNGLGVVIYQLEELALGKSKLEAMPLDFVRLSQHHTGEYLAETVCLVVEKFGIQQKICGIVSDNASNNEVMVRELKKQKWECFKGEGQWKKKKTPNTESTSAQDGSSGSDSGTDDAADQIRPFDRERDTGSEDGESSSSGLDASDDAEDSKSLDLEDIKQASDEDEGDRYTSIGSKESLTKFCAIAKKLRYSPNSKTEFMDICCKKGCSTPHTVSEMFAPGGIQHTSNFAASLDARMLFLSGSVTNDMELCYVPFSPSFSIIHPVGNSLTTILDSVLHPSFRDEYFKLAQWEPEWISEAIRLAREMWVSFYKPKPVESTPSSSSSNTRPKTSMLAGLGSAAAARGGILSSDPLDIWLAGGLIFDGDKPVNPLKWWSQQKRSGNTHGGLVHMALDVLSCPATSVDVERAFSFGRDYVSSKRHRLSSKSLSRGMTVAFYSKNGLIKEGLLDQWKTGIQVGRKLNAKGKGKKKVMVLDED